MILSKNEKTNRGFQLISFKDRSGEVCNIQQSSACDVDFLNEPGASAIWLGNEDANPRIMASKLGVINPETGEMSGWVPYQGIPEDVLLSTQMHLSREQVQWLVEKLQTWLETGLLFNDDAQEEER